MENVFVSDHPLVKHKLSILRNKDTDPTVFRQLVREISILLTYEATQDLKLDPITVMTPLQEAPAHMLRERVGLVPVLRAGLGMVDGVWEMMPSAEVWHIGLYRDEESLRPVEYYSNLPVDPHVQVTLILDPMLATGGTAVKTTQMLKDWGAGRIKYVGLIAAPEGIERLHGDHPDVAIHIGAVDTHLNDVGFIVPGLGDAGDRQFGTG